MAVLLADQCTGECVNFLSESSPFGDVVGFRLIGKSGPEAEGVSVDTEYGLGGARRVCMEATGV